MRKLIIHIIIVSTILVGCGIQDDIISDDQKRVINNHKLDTCNELINDFEKYEIINQYNLHEAINFIDEIITTHNSEYNQYRINILKSEKSASEEKRKIFFFKKKIMYYLSQKLGFSNEKEIKAWSAAAKKGFDELPKEEKQEFETISEQMEISMEKISWDLADLEMRDSYVMRIYKSYLYMPQKDNGIRLTDEEKRIDISEKYSKWLEHMLTIGFDENISISNITKYAIPGSTVP